MQQDKPTINLTVPTGWDKLDDYQLRYVFGLLTQGFPSPQAVEPRSIPSISRIGIENLPYFFAAKLQNFAQSNE